MECKHCHADVAEGTNFCPYCGNQIEIPQSLKCPQCNTDVSDGTKFCPNCGSPVGVLPPKKCSQCGAELEEGEKFCSNCGKAVDSMPTPPINDDIPQAQEAIAEQNNRREDYGLSSFTTAQQTQESTSNINNFGRSNNASSLIIQMEGKILKTKYAFNVVIEGQERYKLNAKDFVETIIPITSNEIKIKTSSLSIYSIDLNLEPNRDYKCVIRLNSMSLPEYELIDENGNVTIKDGEVNWFIFLGSILLPLVGFIYFFIKKKASPLNALLGIYFGFIGLAIYLVKILLL